jgi:polygalacturonase
MPILKVSLRYLLRYLLLAVLVLGLCLTWRAVLAQDSPVCRPEDFGALVDGQHKDTAAIQAAIAQCASSGGTVLLSGGTYLSAPIFLPSRVTLKVESGSILRGSQDFKDYRLPDDLETDLSRITYLSLVNATDATDIAITGQGIIDGAGQPWWEMEFQARRDGLPETRRPRLITLTRCQRIRVQDITLTNSPSFHLVPTFSDDIVIRNIKILAPDESPNTDGIDPIACHRVQIIRCRIDTGDDHIAIKAGGVDPNFPDRGSEDITVRQCTFLHGHGMAIGSGTRRGVRRVLVEDCRFRGGKHGIRIKSGRDRGGEVSQIIYRNLIMEDMGDDISITTYYPDVPATDEYQPIADLTPTFHDITITNLVAKGANQAGAIVGLPEKPLFNITLNQIQIEAAAGLRVRDAMIQTDDVLIQAERGEAIVFERGGRLRDAETTGMLR